MDDRAQIILSDIRSPEAQRVDRLWIGGGEQAVQALAASLRAAAVSVEHEVLWFVVGSEGGGTCRRGLIIETAVGKDVDALLAWLRTPTDSDVATQARKLRKKFPAMVRAWRRAEAFCWAAMDGDELRHEGFRLALRLQGRANAPVVACNEGMDCLTQLMPVLELQAMRAHVRRREQPAAMVWVATLICLIAGGTYAAIQWGGARVDMRLGAEETPAWLLSRMNPDPARGTIVLWEDLEQWPGLDHRIRAAFAGDLPEEWAARLVQRRARYVTVLHQLYEKQLQLFQQTGDVGLLEALLGDLSRLSTVSEETTFRDRMRETDQAIGKLVQRWKGVPDADWSILQKTLAPFRLRPWDGEGRLAYWYERALKPSR